MPTIHLHRTTSLTPERYIAALTDFGPGRAEVFPNSADAYLKVHSRENLKGRLLGFVVGTIGRGVLAKAFERSVRVIEARTQAAGTSYGLSQRNAA